MKKNYLSFKRHFIDLASQRGIDLDFYFTEFTYIRLYLEIIVRYNNVAPSSLSYDDIHNILNIILYEGVKNES